MTDAEVLALFASIDRITIDEGFDLLRREVAVRFMKLYHEFGLEYRAPE